MGKGHQDFHDAMVQTGHDETIIERIVPAIEASLSSVAGSLQLLELGSLGPIPQHQQKIVELAARNAARVSSDLRNMRAYHRVKTGSFMVACEETDLSVIVQNAIDASRPGDDGPAIIASLESARISGDPVLLQQAFAALIENALRVSERGDAVHVRIEQQHGQVDVIIADRGWGISPDERYLLGNAFFQSTRSRSNDVVGIGLGFFVAEKTIATHDALLDVESSSFGTTVRATFRVL